MFPRHIICIELNMYSKYDLCAVQWISLLTILHKLEIELRRAISVSYTHLDVYKRQVLYISETISSMRDWVVRQEIS